jgi:hypothetical protein
MSPEYIALQLLAHGPLNLISFHNITGWKSLPETRQLLENLVDQGKLKPRYIVGGRVYCITDEVAECRA